MIASYIKASVILSKDTKNDQVYIYKKGERCLEDSSYYRNNCYMSKKIIIITQSALVPTQLGCDKRAFFVIEALVSLGHEIHLMGLLPSSTKPSQDDRDLIDQLKISIHTIPILRRNNPMLDYK